MSLEISHVLLTRFNLPTPGVESLIRAKDGWLRDRQALFERYCLPSVKDQSERNFHWIIYFDAESPKWLRARIAELSSDGTFVPLFRQSVPHAQLVQDVEEVAGRRTEILMTTNLDNDDAISKDFVARLQAAVLGPERRAFYVSYGLIQQGRRLFLRLDPTNAFCTVSESWEEPSTCWFDWHNRLDRHMPTTQIPGEPGWLQMVHEGNVSNRIRGRRVSPAGFADAFGQVLQGVEIPGAGELLFDRFVAAPIRRARDFLRDGAKGIIMRLGGKNGLDRLKLAVARGNRNQPQ
ncbi:glycosyltransferase [Arthrobacter rhombi]|uniref:glycosyltransferase n=1 Tax=Arthrobacter rhombi TaxID=71253 RepID=UPI000B34AEAE|nr:glycosyltransferase [Arthrobacter rhombi]